MLRKLLKLVNNLFEIYSKGCRGCKSVCDFIGLKNNKLHHKCNICKKKRWLTTLGKLKLIKKFPNTYKFYNTDLQSYFIIKKVFILMNT